MEKDGSKDAAVDKSHQAKETSNTVKLDWRFWTILISLCIIGFASSLDNSIIFTALPTITDSIGGQSQYVWIVNSYALASTVIQPFVGQLCNIFGRKNPTLISVALFALGAGVAGGADSPAMLIAGRTVQGLGAGGIFVLIDLIVCDLVPQRERGKYLGIVLSSTAIGSTLGPLIGGALAQANWRWVFYITLPFSGLALIWMFFFLNLKHQRNLSFAEVLARMDIVGNTLFIASITSILLGLVMGGSTFPWSSGNVIVPLVLGFVGWIVFHVYERSSFCKEPTMPPRLFGNRTSAVGFFLTFEFGMFLEWSAYFLPLYFQALKGTSPFISGVNTLPLSAFIMPAAMISGAVMSKTGLYQPIHAVAFGFFALAFGLFSILDANSNTAEWVFFQIFFAIGLGGSFVTVLPAIQASLPESDTAASTGAFSFVRSFGIVWGATIPATIFNSQIDANLGMISDPTLRSALANGGAYQYAAGGSRLSSLPATIHEQAVALYTTALKPVWQVGIAFSLLGFLVVFLEKHVELRKELNTEFGIERPEEERPNDVELRSQRSRPVSSAGAGRARSTAPSDSLPVIELEAI
ncbi:hypothetical protein MMC10_001904 [Thelotrema lepadinum]|nr:hypothetical protein [Thelotrema lepadinum]